MPTRKLITERVNILFLKRKNRKRNKHAAKIETKTIYHLKDIPKARDRNINKSITHVRLQSF